MTTSQTFQFVSAAATAAATHGVSTLLPGKAVSLAPRAPMALRVAEGHAWVTLDAGPYGTGAEAGDVFLHAGQTLWVAAGQHAVVEPVGSARLQYRWTSTPVGAASIATPWWRRAAFGSPSVAVASDACCA
ncbi:DUF2917 domain-containing protein [Acidovorax sp. sic0104]|uniref:DUF2917 domain-containing protein n=1 Tax=Acidovorax sp. sic0104 TaxID=2854784 RepID=UPI001C441320|nr:DUF2917 domain-containing protein [Acidovorax sp. sic0104]MBV7541133.1 DUF2917 domain-containing protein [Acidovorax sp. sic0104]